MACATSNAEQQLETKAPGRALSSSGHFHLELPHFYVRMQACQQASIRKPSPCPCRRTQVELDWRRNLTCFDDLQELSHPATQQYGIMALGRYVHHS